MLQHNDDGFTECRDSLNQLILRSDGIDIVPIANGTVEVGFFRSELITAEEQKKVFERFHRVGTGLVHDVKGNGLGLSIVEHVVQAHQGKVTVESSPGKGSTFSIHLPVEANENV